MAKKTLHKTHPTEKRPASASSSSYGVQGPPIFPLQKSHLRNFVARKTLHWKGIHILRVPSPRNHELRMHRRSGSSQYTALGQRLGKVRFVYHPIGRAENEIKSKLKVKDCLSTLRSKSTSYLPGLRIARTGSKPNETQKEPWGFHHCPQALLWVAPPQNKIKLGIKKKGFHNPPTAHRQG